MTIPDHSRHDYWVSYPRHSHSLTWTWTSVLRHKRIEIEGVSSTNKKRVFSVRISRDDFLNKEKPVDTHGIFTGGVYLFLLDTRIATLDLTFRKDVGSLCTSWCGSSRCQVTSRSSQNVRPVSKWAFPSRDRALGSKTLQSVGRTCMLNHLLYEIPEYF